MADDRDARIAQLEAEVRQLRAADRAREATLVDKAEHYKAALDEAHELQTATMSILRIIASSPVDLDRLDNPLQSILNEAARLCDAEHSHIVQPNWSTGK
jgi:hypothetical protein